jgi:hypothetical protein
MFDVLGSRAVTPVLPVVGLKPSSEVPRARVYTDDELRLIVRGLKGTPHEDVVRLILATGSRITATVSAEWADLDLKQALWIIPAEKRKTRKTRPSAHAAPLTQDAVRRLERRRAALRDSCRWVFPAKRSGSFWRWGSAEDEAVRERTGVADLRAHDLRRTMATRIRALGFPREMVDAVLGRPGGAARARDSLSKGGAGLNGTPNSTSEVRDGRLDAAGIAIGDLGDLRIHPVDGLRVQSCVGLDQAQQIVSDRFALSLSDLRSGVENSPDVPSAAQHAATRVVVLQSPKIVAFTVRGLLHSRCHPHAGEFNESRIWTPAHSVALGRAAVYLAPPRPRPHRIRRQSR